MRDFANEMASLFKGLGIEEPRTGSEGTGGAAEQERLAAAWEAMLVEGMDTMSGPSNGRTPADPSSPGLKEDDFQSRIRSTMNKLKESESGLKSSDSSASAGGAETFESLLSHLKDLGDLPGDGAESEEQLQGVLEAMMGQLMNKDVLYEPLKELHDKVSMYFLHATSLTRGGPLSSLSISPRTAVPYRLKIRSALRHKYRASSGCSSNSRQRRIVTMTRRLVKRSSSSWARYGLCLRSTMPCSRSCGHAVTNARIAA